MTVRSRLGALAAVVLTALALTGLSSATALAPQAAACEKHEKQPGQDCHGQPGRPGSTVTISGTLTDGVLLVFTVNAQLADGQASGDVSVNGTPGPVQEIVLPQAIGDDYCINYVQPDGARTNLLFRDTGDGVLTRDVFNTTPRGPDVTCTNTLPNGSLIPTTVGDLRVTRS